MNALDGSVVYTAPPSITATTAALQWIHAAYALATHVAILSATFVARDHREPVWFAKAPAGSEPSARPSE